MKQQLMIKKNNKNIRQKWKDRLEELKNQYKKLNDFYTLNTFKILNEYYEIGKKLHSRFSLQQVAIDFDIGWERCRRILSLKRANKKTWDLMKKKKISAYKVAQICLTKSIEYQDEIVNDVIKYDLSTRDIEKIKKKTKEEYKKDLNEKILTEGYTLKANAFTRLKNIQEKMLVFLFMDLNSFSESKHKEIYIIFKKINEETEKWMKINEKLK